jgi:hypothetical protein
VCVCVRLLIPLSSVARQRWGRAHDMWLKAWSTLEEHILSPAYSIPYSCSQYPVLNLQHWLHFNITQLPYEVFFALNLAFSHQETIIKRQMRFFMGEMEGEIRLNQQ